MITVISSTNRIGSKSLPLARFYKEILDANGALSQLLSLEQLPADFASSILYDQSNEMMQKIIDQFIVPAEKFVFVIPEYNGSFPGVLKAFIDGIHPRHFKEKKAAIIGLSDGHAGNLRGQEHLTGILHYLKLHVHYNKPKLSIIDELLDEKDQLTDQRTIKILNEHAKAVINF